MSSRKPDDLDSTRWYRISCGLGEEQLCLDAESIMVREWDKSAIGFYLEARPSSGLSLWDKSAMGLYWQILPDKEDSIRLRSRVFGPDRYLSLNEESGEPYLSQKESNDYQRWKVLPEGRADCGGFVLVNPSTSRALVVDGEGDILSTLDWGSFEAWYIDAVEDMIDDQFSTKGWVKEWDSLTCTFRYLNILSMTWQQEQPDLDATGPPSAPPIRFDSWVEQDSPPRMGNLDTYLEWKLKERIVDVSFGLSSPKMLYRPHLSRPRIGKVPVNGDERSFVSSCDLVSRNGNFLLCISKGTRFSKTDLPPFHPIDGRGCFFQCKISNDGDIVLVNSMYLREVGIEDDIPETFLWSKYGVDVEFQDNEDIPLQHKIILGHGSSAVVDKVICQDRTLARKQIRCNRRLTHQTALKELSAIRKVQSHQHVVNIVGSYTKWNSLGILFHPAAECDLQTALERFYDPQSLFAGRGTFEQHLDHFAQYFGCLAHAIAYIHQQSIRHRDIKPRNILVTVGGPLLTDFGIARDFSDNHHSTTSGPAERTYIYCAPEVSNQDNRGRSADIFSLGCVFLELYTVLLGKATFIDCVDRRTNPITGDCSFHQNLDPVSEWLHLLRSQHYRRLRNSYDAIIRTTQDGRAGATLRLIESMLQADRNARPTALSVWTAFSSSSELCGRCCVDNPKALSSPDQGGFLTLSDLGISSPMTSEADK